MGMVDIGARLIIRVGGLREARRELEQTEREVVRFGRSARAAGQGGGGFGGGFGGGGTRPPAYSHTSPPRSRAYDRAPAPERRWMSASYGFEQTATQLERVGSMAQRSIEQPVKLAMDFEDQMKRVAALTIRGLDAQAAEKATADLQAEARRLGANTRYTASEAAQGMQFLAMAGYDAQRQIATMPAVLDLASIGVLEVGRSADIAVNIMGGFQLGAEESTRVVDRLAAAVTAGNVTLTDLAYTMKYLGPVAKASGQDLESMLGWASYLGDAGIKGSMAGTGSREVLARLAAPKGKGKRLLDKYGIKTTDEQGNLRNATEVLGEIGVAWARSGKGNAEISQEAVDMFGKFHRSTALVLIAGAAKGMAATDVDLGELQAAAGAGVNPKLDAKAREKLWNDSLQRKIGLVRESDGLGSQMARRMESGTAGQWREFQSAMEETGITVGEQILPMLVELMKTFKPMVIELATWAKEHPTLIKALAGGAMLGIALSVFATPFLHFGSAIFALIGIMGRLRHSGVLGMFGGPRPLVPGLGPGGRPRDELGRYRTMTPAERLAWQTHRDPYRSSPTAPMLAGDPRRQPRRRWSMSRPASHGGMPARLGLAGPAGSNLGALGALGGAFAAFEIGRGIGTILEDNFQLSDKIATGLTMFENRFFGGLDSRLNRLNGGRAGQRGGAKFRLEDDEGRARLAAFEREKDVAAQLGVSYETIKRARAQGIDLNTFAGGKGSRGRQMLEQFVAREQAKDQAATAAETARSSKAAIVRQQLDDIAKYHAGRTGENVSWSAAATRAAMGEGPQTGLSGMIARAIQQGMQDFHDQGVQQKIRITVEGAGVVGATGEGADVSAVDTG